ncbi:MAG: IclR family transcriptional regulator [Paracoccaceae bacterium]
MSRNSESSIVTKCGQVIDILSASRRPLAFSEIVQRTGFVKSSCHRILAVLQGEEMIEYDKASRTYRTGKRLQKWARATWNRADIQQTASQHMSDLCETTRMNTALSVFDTDAILYLRTVDFHSVRFASHAGDRAPLHSTAAGKVFLANMNPARQQATLARIDFEKFTEHTLVSLEPLVAQFAEIRTNGYATARGEETLPVTGIAAPIWNAEDKLAACLSLWSTRDQHAPEEVLDRANKLVALTKQISAELGAEPE